MTYEIKNRWTGEVIFSIEAESLKVAVKMAIDKKIRLRDSDLRGSYLSGSDLRDSDLSGSNLSGSNLSGSNLRDSDLRGSDLSGSDLSGSDLSGSDLSGSDLRDSNLRDSNLRDSDLRGSNLSDSNLSGSNLSGSDLSGSDLSGSDLRGSDLSDSDLRGSDLRDARLDEIRNDFWHVLSARPNEVAGLRNAIVEGKINGSQYSGECACLVGTIANVALCKYNELEGLKPDASRPAERFFLAINPGDTPDKRQPAKIVLEWLDEWMDNQKKVENKI